MAQAERSLRQVEPGTAILPGQAEAVFPGAEGPAQLDQAEDSAAGVAGVGKSAIIIIKYGLSLGLPCERP